MAFDQYFDRRASQFSRFYRSEPVARLLGRGALFDRRSFAVAKAAELGATTVVDIGCGSGVLFAPLAERGIRVTGVEPAPAMLALAREEAARSPDLVEVRAGVWEDFADRDAFDLAVALGVFDYVTTPVALLQAMAAAAPHVVGSFPAPGARTTVRQVRYGARGVTVRGYSRPAIDRLLADAGLIAREVSPLGRAGFAVLAARAEGPPGPPSTP